jgi:hypothetical protein
MPKKSTLNDVTWEALVMASTVSRMLHGWKRTVLPNTAKVKCISYTVMHDAPAGFDETTPYAVALFKLEEGPVVTAQLTDLGE